MLVDVISGKIIYVITILQGRFQLTDTLHLPLSQMKNKIQMSYMGTAVTSFIFGFQTGMAN